MPCTSCHAIEERAALPPVEKCQGCHKQITEFAKPVRRVPDFVFFSHARHQQAKLECASCHGTLVDQPAPAKMKACVDCHKTHKATIVCTACHELSQ
jgi:transposase